MVIIGYHSGEKQFLLYWLLNANLPFQIQSKQSDHSYESHFIV